MHPAHENVFIDDSRMMLYLEGIIALMRKIKSANYFAGNRSNFLFWVGAASQGIK